MKGNSLANLEALAGQTERADCYFNQPMYHYLFGMVVRQSRSSYPMALSPASPIRWGVSTLTMVAGTSATSSLRKEDDDEKSP